MELNPFSYGFHEDPYPTYRWLRDNAPVYRNDELNFYALSRYQDVLAASVDHETYSSAKGTVLEMDPQMAEAFPIILFMDPPRQTRVARRIARAHPELRDRRGPPRTRTHEQRPRFRQAADEILKRAMSESVDR